MLPLRHNSVLTHQSIFSLVSSNYSSAPNVGEVNTFWILHKWDHTVLVFLDLMYLIWHNHLQFYLCHKCHNFSLFFIGKVIQTVYLYCVCICFHHGGDNGISLYFSVSMYSGRLNMKVWMSHYTAFIVFGYMWGYWIMNELCILFLRNLHILSINAVLFTFSPTMDGVPFSPHLTVLVIFGVFFL